MCPDPKMLSLYKDNELPEPWKNKITDHLAECTECSTHLQNYKNISDKITGITPLIEDNIIREAGLRVWQRLPEAVINGEVRQTKKYSIIIPYPLAAAAVAVFVFAIVLSLFSFMNSSSNPKIYEPVTAYLPDKTSSAELSGIVPVTDLSGIIQYLSRQEPRDYVLIQLPDSRSFSYTGEPALLRRADYTGKKVGRLNPLP